MKKNLRFIIIIVLTMFLVGFVYDRIAAPTVGQAASETSPAAETGVVPLTRSEHPVVFAVIALVGVLFGAIAIFPLLIGTSCTMTEGEWSEPKAQPAPHPDAFSRRPPRQGAGAARTARDNAAC
jgi:hypothetical protein